MNNFVPGLLTTRQPKKRALLSSPLSYRPPLHIDRRSELLTASNQGKTSQCVAYALAGWLEFYNWRNKGICDQIYPAPIYKRAKEIDGFPNEDGTSLEAGLQAAQDLGLMSAVEQSSIREVTTPLEVKAALHRHGIVFSAFTATDLWNEPAADGWMQPNGAKLGGHAVILVGFSDVEVPNYFSLQNSWGADIGWRGFVRMSPQQFQDEFVYGLVWDWLTPQATKPT